MAVAAEAGIGTINFNKQAAKGTMATAASIAVGTNRPKLFDQSLKANKTLDSEEYLDGQRFASAAQFVSQTGGEVGDVEIQVQPENAGLFHAQIIGADTVTGGSDPYTHTIATSNALGGYGTWWSDVGNTVRNREVYWDTKIAKSVFEAGTDKRVAHQTMSLMSLKPAEVYTTNPTKTEDATDPYLWTEVSGAVSIDGTVIKEVEGEVLEIDTAMKAFSGDQVETLQLIEQKGKITRTIRSILTDETQLKFYKMLYNTTTPADGTRPTLDVLYFALSTLYTRSASRSISITTPRVAVNPSDLQVGGKREGGEIPIVFTGEALKDGSTAALTIVVKSADATTYL